MIHFIAQVLELPLEAAKRLPFAHWAWSASCQHRAPVFELLNIFEHNDTRANSGCPPNGDPREPTHTLRDWLATLRLAEVLAVWRQPHQANRSASGGFQRINFPDVLAIVLRRRMVCRVQCDRFGVVIDGDVRRTAEGHFDAERRAAAPSEGVDDEFSHDALAA